MIEFKKILTNAETAETAADDKSHIKERLSEFKETSKEYSFFYVRKNRKSMILLNCCHIDNPPNDEGLELWKRYPRSFLAFTIDELKDWNKYMMNKYMMDEAESYELEAFHQKCNMIVKHERAVKHVYHVDMQIFLDEINTIKTSRRSSGTHIPPLKAAKRAKEANFEQRLDKSLAGSELRAGRQVDGEAEEAKAKADAEAKAKADAEAKAKAEAAGSGGGRGGGRTFLV